jgi:hypothetical protein
MPAHRLAVQKQPLKTSLIEARDRPFAIDADPRAPRNSRGKRMGEEHA